MQFWRDELALIGIMNDRIAPAGVCAIEHPHLVEELNLPLAVSISNGLFLETNMGCAPLAELTAEFSTTDPPKLLGYMVVVSGTVVATLSLQELALAGFSPTPEVHFEVAEEVKAGSILFWHPSDGLLHQDPGEGGTPIGVTTKDLALHSVVRPSFDGFILLDGQFNLTEAELIAIANNQAAQ